MRYRFKTRKLKALLDDPDCTHRYPPSVVDAFDEAMAAIDSAPDERTLFQVRGLNLEKLKGARRKMAQWSMRLNDQWRLIVCFEEDQNGKYVLIDSITSHYQ